MDSGITPAYAGKSADRSPSFQNRRDHPRLCGEKLEPYRRTAEKLGITPAYAGKSAHRNLFFRSSQDHPRLCGEKTKKILKQRYFFHQPASFSFSLQYT